MNVLSVKYLEGLQLDAGHIAIGSPQVSGTGVSAVMSAGIESAAQKYIEIPVSSHFTVVDVNRMPT